MGSSVMVCVVAKDNFVYFLGGLAPRSRVSGYSVTDADRYDLNTDKWDKKANFHMQTEI